MNEFDTLRDPLDEPIHDEELHELLRRLGEAELGGDGRATVGAVVEATGLDAAVVLRTLGEIRGRALDLQREALAAMERRVSNLEARRSARPTYSQIEETSGSNKTAGAIVALAAFFFVLVLALVAGGTRRSSGGNRMMFSTLAKDGEISIGADGDIEVVRPDGSRRDPTPDEESMARSLASAVEKGR